METKALTEKQRVWNDHLQRCTDQGIGLAEYARQHDLDVARLYRWKSVLARRSSSVIGNANTHAALDTPEPFIRAVIQSAVTHIVFPNGITLECPGGLDETLLTTLARLRFAV